MQYVISRFFLLFLTTSFSVTSLAEDAQKAPQDWVLSTQAGKQVSWQDLQGKPTILHFWATWCPYCKKLQPGLEKVYQKYQSQGLQLIGISFREDPGTFPQTVLDERGHQFTTLVDGEPVAKLFGVSGTPTTFFIYADGTVLGMTRTSNPEDPGLEKAASILVSRYK